jgi:inorganic pyrophosphatase/exopolyphosphatase
MDRTGAGGVPTVPVLPPERDELRLRPEVSALAEASGVDLRGALFGDDEGVRDLLRAQRLEVVLVDHNHLPPELEHLHAAVMEIIDHHHDEGRFPHIRRRRVEPCGSTATLVADEILRRAPSLLTPPAATLLLGAVAVDTAGLRTDTERATDLDRRVAAELEKRVGRSAADVHRTLQRAAEKAMDLPTPDLLRRDYKHRRTKDASYGLSSVQADLHLWRARSQELTTALHRFADERSLDVHVLMCYHTAHDGTFTRAMAVTGSRRFPAADLIAALRREGAPCRPFGQPTTAGSVGRSTAWVDLGDPNLSRKVLQPVLHRVLTDFAAEGES